MLLDRTWESQYERCLSSHLCSYAYFFVFLFGALGGLIASASKKVVRRGDAIDSIVRNSFAILLRYTHSRSQRC